MLEDGTIRQVDLGLVGDKPLDRARFATYFGWIAELFGNPVGFCLCCLKESELRQQWHVLCLGQGACADAQRLDLGDMG